MPVTSKPRIVRGSQRVGFKRRQGLQKKRLKLNAHVREAKNIATGGQNYRGGTGVNSTERLKGTGRPLTDQYGRQRPDLTPKPQQKKAEAAKKRTQKKAMKARTNRAARGISIGRGVGAITAPAGGVRPFSRQRFR